MKTKIFLLIASIVIGVITISCQQEESCKKYNDKQTLIPSKKAFEASSAEYVNERLAIYAPFELTADISHLSEKEVEIVGILFKVARIMDGLFWQQTIGGKADFIPAIADKSTKRFARINYGPWDRLNNNKPFIAGVGEKPRGANFYPADMTKEEFETFDDPNKTSLYTLIRRDENGSLKTVWYHEAYSCELQEASDLLKEAAALAEDPGLKKYLELRAEALVSDNYQPSDFAWMEMQNTNIDFVVGAIENYEDALFGYKAMDMYAEAERIDLLPSDMNYSVSLAFSAEEKGFCIIDGLFYQQGAFLPDDAQIVAIEPRRVMVMKDNLQQWISVEKR